MVFINEAERSAYPLRSRRRSMMVATPVMIVSGGVIVSAKLAPFALVLLVATLAVSAVLRGTLMHDLKSVRPGGIVLSGGVLAGYCALSTMWAPIGWPPVEAAGRLVAALLLSFAAFALVSNEDRRNILHMSESIWVGLLVVCVLFTVDAMMQQALKIFVYNAIGLRPGDLTPESWHLWKDGKLVRIYNTDLTRNAFGMPLLLWPALLGVAGITGGRLRLAIRLLVLVAVVAAILASTNETAKIALGAGLAVYALAFLSRTWARNLVIAGALAASLATIPIVKTMHAAGLANASWLPASGRSRIMIWNYTVDAVPQHWVGGIGARMTYHMHEKLSPAPNSGDAAWYKDPKGTPPGKLSLHSHNMFVQTWFELGAVGAILLAVFLMSIGMAMARLGDIEARHGLAMFASAMVLAASSYGMWQLWFTAMFALAAALFMVAASACQTAPADASPERAR